MKQFGSSGQVSAASDPQIVDGLMAQSGKVGKAFEAADLPLVGEEPTSSSSRAPSRDSLHGQSGLSMEWLLAQPDLPVLIQVLPTAELFQLLGSGTDCEALFESAEIVEWVRGRALVKLFDHELWNITDSLIRPVDFSDEHGSKPVLVNAHRFLDWVAVWSEITPEFAGERFLELDEETMVLVCRALFEVVPVGFEGNRKDSDDWFFSPDQKFHLRFRVENPEAQDRAAIFLKSLYAARFELAGRVFAYAAMLVEAEAEEEAMRWRGARLADDGFVSRDEALAILRVGPMERWDSAFLARCRATEASVQAQRDSEGTDTIGGLDIDPDVVDAVRGLLREESDTLHPGLRDSIAEERSAQADDDDDLPVVHDFGNGLADDLAESMVRRCMQKVALKSASLSGMKALSSAQSAAASSDVARESPSSSHGGTGLLLVDRVLAALADEASCIEARVFKSAELKSRIARLTNALASLLAEPAQQAAQRRAAAVTKALMNLGLEWLCDGRPSLAEWSAAALDSTSQDLARHAHAHELLVGLGPEVVFRAGMDLVGALSRVAAASLDSLVTNPIVNPVKDFPETLGSESVKPSAATGSFIYLLERAQYSAAALRLEDNEARLDPHVAILARALLRRIPVFPLALARRPEQGSDSVRIRQGYKVLETPFEFSQCWRAVNSWTHLKLERNLETTDLH